MTDAELMRVIAENVKRLRKAMRPKMSQAVLADLAGMHKNSINALEKHKKKGIEVAALRAIAKALGATVDDLLTPVAGTEPITAVMRVYRESPWAQIDKPTDDEMTAVRRIAMLSWFGAEPDPEALHHLVEALRKRGK